MTVVKISVAAAIMLAASCRHKDLCYDHTHMVDLRVDFDWSLAPSAQPSTMVLCLFPTDGGQGRAPRGVYGPCGRRDTHPRRQLSCRMP